MHLKYLDKSMRWVQCTSWSQCLNPSQFQLSSEVHCSTSWHLSQSAPEITGHQLPGQNSKHKEKYLKKADEFVLHHPMCELHVTHESIYTQDIWQLIEWFKDLNGLFLCTTQHISSHQKPSCEYVHPPPNLSFILDLVDGRRQKAMCLQSFQVDRSFSLYTQDEPVLLVCIDQCVTQGCLICTTYIQINVVMLDCLQPELGSNLNQTPGSVQGAITTQSEPPNWVQVWLAITPWTLVQTVVHPVHCGFFRTGGMGSKTHPQDLFMMWMMSVGPIDAPTCHDASHCRA